MKTCSLLLLILLLAACSSAPEQSEATSDYLELREVINDDPLATPYETPDGTEVRLGDRILSGAQASTLRMKQNEQGSYDMLVSLTGVVQARWRRFAGSRRPREAALLVQGRILSVFMPEKPDNTVDKEVLTFAIPAVAEDEDAAEALNAILDRHVHRADPEESK